MKFLVGTFTEQDLKQGKDKVAVKKAMDEHDLHYTETKYIEKNGEIVGLKIWVCDAETFTI